jgi:DNA-binding TFAR19-related protein (PDSD5 family)
LDEELERIKRRRMREIQRKLLKQESPEKKVEKPKELTSDEILNNFFSGRAWEVYETAKKQFPMVMPKVTEALVEGIKSGKIKERIDGESLFVFLKQVGLRVRLNTSIRYKEHGELKTIGQRIKEK